MADSASIGAKVAHVKAARQTRKHACHWPGCPINVPPAMWGCRPHWYALPQEIRDRIWETYRPGQEITGTPTVAYLNAAQDAQEWIQKHLKGPMTIEPGKTIAERIAAIYDECKGVMGTSGITSWEQDRLGEWKDRTYLSPKQEAILQTIEKKAGLRGDDDE